MNNYILPDIITCGYFNCAEEFGNLKKSPLRLARGIEIEFFLEDGLSTYIDGTEYKVKKDHIIVAKDGSTRNSLLPFKTVFLKIAAEGELQKLLCTLPNYFPALHAEPIKELLGDIIRLHEDKQRNALLIGAKILTLSDYLIRDAGRRDVAGKDSYTLMHRAKKIIETRFGEKISTGDIAAEINLSESRFRVLFRQVYKISPHQYLTEVRVSHAKQMMWDNHSMTEIAEQCGFTCQQYLSEIFKRETGLPPGKYRAELVKRYYDTDDVP